jgi:TalC/MipB family fructose-6-phosphate aldolase
MKLFIDSADRPTVEKLLRTGLFSGITTNPAILHKAGLGSSDIPDLVSWATAAGAEQVFVQSWGDTAEEIADRGRSFRELDSRVVVKVTASYDGIQAAHSLAEDGSVLVTAVFAAAQVVPIMAAGATYVAPFVGQMIAGGREGIDETIAMQKAIQGTRSPLQVLAGSLRSGDQISRLAAAGVENFTLGPAVWDSLFLDELTDAAALRFNDLATA